MAARKALHALENGDVVKAPDTKAYAYVAVGHRDGVPEVVGWAENLDDAIAMANTDVALMLRWVERINGGERVAIVP